MSVTVSISSHSSSDPDRSGVSLRITDDVSRETVVYVTFTLEQFARVVMNQLTPGIEARFGVLARVGLVPTNETTVFDSYKQAKEAELAAERLAKPAGPLKRVSVSKSNDGKTRVTLTKWKEP